MKLIDRLVVCDSKWCISRIKRKYYAGLPLTQWDFREYYSSKAILELEGTLKYPGLAIASFGSSDPSDHVFADTYHKIYKRKSRKANNAKVEEKAYKLGLK